jgi:pyruvate-formate lyase-activating enzyme
MTRPALLLADRKGRIYPAIGLAACGMEAGHIFQLDKTDLIKLPKGSQLFTLPDRVPAVVGAVREPPLPNGLNPVAAFLPPGYTVTHSAAYREMPVRARHAAPLQLPLFAYAALAYHKGEYYAAAIKVDNDTRHDCTLIDMAEVVHGVKGLRKAFPKNRLVRHLEDCALKYGCAGAQNFFLGKHEGPLPSSPVCNAVCLGCISYQVRKKCPETQPRIKFTPSPEEIAEIALFHIARVKNTVVSFGQGCDGEPLMAGDTIERAIRLIRIGTSVGTININTNGSKPDTVRRLFDAGLDSIRVSMNSAREEFYARYYKPRGYSFKDVMETLKIARKNGRFISLNYLTMPGFTDTKREYSALDKLVGKYKIDMIQWRNLNYDPMEYFREMDAHVERSEILGVRHIMRTLKTKHPKLIFGYFNPHLSLWRKVRTPLRHPERSEGSIL